jgi:hypothetical protein
MAQYELNPDSIEIFTFHRRHSSLRPRECPDWCSARVRRPERLAENSCSIQDNTWGPIVSSYHAPTSRHLAWRFLRASIALQPRALGRDQGLGRAGDNPLTLCGTYTLVRMRRSPYPATSMAVGLAGILYATNSLPSTAGSARSDSVAARTCPQAQRDSRTFSTPGVAARRIARSA